MNVRLVASVAVVALAGLGAAVWLGLFDRRPASPAESSVAADTPSTPVETPPAVPAPTTEPAPAPGRPLKLNEASAPVPAEPSRTATLRVETDVPGADVFIDNQFAGKAPATIADVQPGRRKISVSATGYETMGEFHDLTPGPRDIVISLKTIRLDRRIAVTHKHRLGSCTGTLIATPAGLRYDTARTEDAFTAALQDLETFKADYLNKNLEVAIRGGRSYNFTDPSGKADDLYQFFQDVDKVRQRLIKQGAPGGI